MVGSGCRRGAASHWNKKEKLHAALPRPQALAVDSGDDCDYVPRLAGALPRVTAQRDQGAAPYFHSLVTAPGLPSADTAPLSPRPAHFTGMVSWTGIQEGRLWAFWLEIFKFDQMTSHITSTLIEIKPLRPEISWCPPSARAGRVAPLLPLFTSGLAWLGVTWPS